MARHPTAPLLPLSDDPDAAIDLARRAVEEACAREGVDPAPFVAHETTQIRGGAREGRLLRRHGKAVGIAAWNAGHPLGLEVQVWYLDPEVRSITEYEKFLEAIESVAPVVSMPTGWPGIPPEAEAQVGASRSFGRFERSEMKRTLDDSLPAAEMPPGVSVRQVRPDDEPAIAGLYQAAFAGQFDAYLFLLDRDPAIDAARSVQWMMSGHWGDLLSHASFVAEADGHPRGASLVVRGTTGPLLVSLMVDPAYQRRRIGRALVLASLHGLRVRQEPHAVLNVTEGNAPAVHLYRALGFERSLGPEARWYSTKLVPVAPGAPTSRPPSGTPTNTPGSAARRTPSA